MNPQFEMQRQLDRHNKALAEIKRLEARLIEAGCTLRGDYLWQKHLDEALEAERNEVLAEARAQQISEELAAGKAKEAKKKKAVDEALEFEQKRELARKQLAASEKEAALAAAKTAEAAKKNAAGPGA